MYLPCFLSLLFTVLCLADAALLQNLHLARSDLTDSPLSPTGDSKMTGAGSGSEAIIATSDSASSPSPSVTSPEVTESPTEVSSSESPTEKITSSSPSPSLSSSSATSPPIVKSTSKSTPPNAQNPEPTPTSQQPPAQPIGESTSSQQPAKSTVVTTVTSTSTDAAESTDNAPKTSSTPNLNSDKDNTSSGMPPKTRNTVIGVVVGIGGAILLGALAMVAYRIWGRKKLSEENDGLMSYDMGNNAYDKQEQSVPVSGGQQTPFQSTLENYHQPSHVTASSNF